MNKYLIPSSGRFSASLLATIKRTKVILRQSSVLTYKHMLRALATKITFVLCEAKRQLYFNLRLGITSSVAIVLLCSASFALAQKYQAAPDGRLTAKVSKSGLNRISNWPYQIVQVTGDDSTFRLKSDEDGKNIYLMPLGGVGDKIEISIKNNAGFVQDLELEVSAIKGQSIAIDSNKVINSARKLQQQTLRQMLRAMRSFTVGKFYVQNTKKALDSIDNLTVVQTKLYKWQDLVGGVFVITNNTKLEQSVNVAQFIKRFDHVLTSFVTSESLASNQTGHIFVIQKTK